MPLHLLLPHSMNLLRGTLVSLLYNRSLRWSEPASTYYKIDTSTCFQEVNKLSNAHAETEVVNLDILQDSHKIKKIFQQSVNGEVYELIRVRRMKDEAVILDKDYFVRDVVPRLPLNECKVSVYRYLEEELGLQISYAVKEITVQKANAEDYELLDMGDYNMVVVVKSHTYLENNTLFQCTESRHRPDKFRLRFHLF